MMNGILLRFGKTYAISGLFLFLFIFLFLFPPRAYAGETPKHPLAELEGGVVTGQLVTVAGNTFFQHFIARWRDQPLSDRYSITVHERPSALRGSQIKIDCSNRTVFIATLPNSRSDLKSFAERAADITFQNTSEAEIQRLLFRDADLGPDEL